MVGKRFRIAVLLVATAVCAVLAGTANASRDRAAGGRSTSTGTAPATTSRRTAPTYAKSQLSGTDINRPGRRLQRPGVPDAARVGRRARPRPHGRPRVALYAAKGVLQPMDSCVADVKNQYRVGAIKAMTYGGHIYGLPEFTNQMTLIVNQSAFKDCGRAGHRRADEELEAAARDHEEADRSRLERQPDPHRLRPEDRPRSTSRCGPSGSARTSSPRTACKAQLNTRQASPR